MPNGVRALISRVLAPIVVYLLAWICVKLGVVVSEVQLHDIAEFIILLLLTGVVDKLFARKLNPHDVASPRAVAETKGAP